MKICRPALRAVAFLYSFLCSAQDTVPYVSLHASAYLTQSALINRGALTGVGREDGYAFRSRPGIMGDVMVDWKPRGRDAKWTLSSGVGIWWWSYRVGLRRDVVPGDLFYLPTEGQGAIALQVPLRATYRLQRAIEAGAGISFTRHLDGGGRGSGVSTTYTDRVRLETFSGYESRPYSSATGDVFLSFRASKRLTFSLRGTMDSRAFAPVYISSTVTDAAGSRSYTYWGAPKFFLYSFGASYVFFGGWRRAESIEAENGG